MESVSSLMKEKWKDSILGVLYKLPGHMEALMYIPNTVYWPIQRREELPLLGSFFFLKHKASDYFLVFPCWQFHYCHPEENESHKGIAVLLSKLTKKSVQWWQRKMLTTSSRTLLIWGKEMISSIRYILWLHNIQKTWLNCQWY